MKDFPKTLYATIPADMIEDLEEGDIGPEDLSTYDNQKTAMDGEEEGTKIAVYQLVKQGVIKTQRKVVFE